MASCSALRPRSRNTAPIPISRGFPSCSRWIHLRPGGGPRVTPNFAALFSLSPNPTFPSMDSEAPVKQGLATSASTNHFHSTDESLGRSGAIWRWAASMSPWQAVVRDPGSEMHSRARADPPHPPYTDDFPSAYHPPLLRRPSFVSHPFNPQRPPQLSIIVPRRAPRPPKTTSTRRAH